ncbi:NAD(P)/FAD-dependent oxidoreductase [Roseovarius aestuarii]|nr:NAD(P)/FAD-dependent oxidoreductase [Roseovarius aestuarii]
MVAYDAVIVGGGHNGLVCGAYLSKAGRRVCVLERRAILGGASVTEEVWDGYRVNTAAHMLGLLQPRVILDLELADFGYEVITPPPTVHILENGSSVTVWRETERVAAELARFSQKDAARYPEYIAHINSLGPIIRKLLWEIPPDPADLSIRGLVSKLGFAARNLGLLRRFHDISDLLTMSAYDYLSRWFESEQAMVILGYYPSAGSGQRVSIHTAGTAFFLTRGQMRENNTQAGGTGLVRGGMGRICEAIVASASRYGMETRTNAVVEKVNIDNGRATGVTLQGGEVINARTVIANASIQSVVSDLVGAEHLPADYSRAVQGLNQQSSAFKMHVATSSPPVFHTPDSPADANSPHVQYTIAPSVAYLERAYNELNSGQMSARPFLTVQIPTLADPSLAPPGKHLLSIYGGHVPVPDDMNGLAQVREKIIRTVEETIADHATITPGWIEHSQVMLPQDYEDIFGLPGGCPHHFNLALDQMFFRRPVAKFADYTTPVTGLFLCSASAHPGGGVSGVPGFNASRVVQKALRKLR